MPLDSEGRVVLKIYNDKGQLLIARPCPSTEFAQEWFKKYQDGKPQLTYYISAMVPRV